MGWGVPTDMRGKRRQPSSELDLHGLTRGEAERTTLEFIRFCQTKGTTKCIVITGRGRESGPVLRDHLKRLLTGAWKKYLDDLIVEDARLVLWLKSAHRSALAELERKEPRTLIREARSALSRDPRAAARIVNYLISSYHSHQLEPVSPNDLELLTETLDLLGEHYAVPREASGPRARG